MVNTLNKSSLFAIRSTSVLAITMSVAINPRPALKAKLTKEPFSIPNLKPYYKAWPTAVNPNYPQLKVALEARIKEYVRP